MTSAQQVKTWGQAFDWQFRRWRRGPTAKTQKINAGHITRHIGLSYPVSKMGKLSFWIDLQQDLLDENRSTSGVNRIVSVASHCVRETYLAELHKTPVPQFKRLKEGKHRLTWYTKADVEKMFSAACEVFDNRELADAMVFSAYTGVRQGELLKLRGEDVDLAHNNIWVGGKPDRINKGNEGGRAIPIAERIKPLVIARKDQRRLFGDHFPDKDTLYYQFKKVRDYCGIPEDHVWHTFRHSFGTWLGAETHPKQIQSLMGHADISTTLRYVKATDEANHAAIAAL